MSSLEEYTLGMDYVREKYGFAASASIYEIVNKLISELKRVEGELQKSQEEKSWKKTKKTQSKSKK